MISSSRGTTRLRMKSVICFRTSTKTSSGTSGLPVYIGMTMARAIVACPILDDSFGDTVARTVALGRTRIGQRGLPFMDIAQVRAFLAVAEELHFRRAAERLHMAQPPLTRTIKLLERELGTTLFERNTRSVALTPAGQAMLEPAREVLEALRRATEAARSADRGEVGLVRIAFAGVSTHPLVATLARNVRSARPGIELELSSQNFAQPAIQKLA